MRFVVTIREVRHLSIDVDVNSPEEAERLAWEDARRSPPSAWQLQERELVEVVRIDDAQAGRRANS